MAVIPPSVVALTQNGGTQGLSVLAVLTAVQATIGQWLEPMVQGKALEISPLVVLLSVVFWGWVWGIGGALLSVPMTVLFIALCERSRRWSWIAELITDTTIEREEDENDDDATSNEPSVGPADELASANGGLSP